jgi:hypothetical protein
MIVTAFARRLKGRPFGDVIAEWHYPPVKVSD